MKNWTAHISIIHSWNTNTYTACVVAAVAAHLLQHLFLMTPDMTQYEFGTHINRNAFTFKVNAWNEKTKWKTFHFWQAVQGWDFLMVDKIIVFLCWLQPETKLYTCNLINPFNAITTSTSTTGRVKMQSPKLKIDGGRKKEENKSTSTSHKQAKHRKVIQFATVYSVIFQVMDKKKSTPPPKKQKKKEHTSFVPWLNICLVDTEVLTITGTGLTKQYHVKTKANPEAEGKTRRWVRLNKWTKMQLKICSQTWKIIFPVPSFLLHKTLDSIIYYIHPFFSISFFTSAEHTHTHTKHTHTHTHTHTPRTISRTIFQCKEYILSNHNILSKAESLLHFRHFILEQITSSPDSNPLPCPINTGAIWNTTLKYCDTFTKWSRRAGEMDERKWQKWSKRQFFWLKNRMTHWKSSCLCL